MEDTTYAVGREEYKGIIILAIEEELAIVPNASNSFKIRISNDI